MSLLRSLLPLSYPVLRAGRLARRSLGGGVPALRVLLYHDIPPEGRDAFGRQLRWLQQRWRFLSPAQFEAVLEGREPLRGDSLLLTFDDGFASNLDVALQVLQPLGIQAIFFVVSAFIDQPDRAGARRFICERLQAGRDPQALPAHWSNMGWDDLAQLLRLGHTIGAHTASHERLVESTPPDVMEREVAGGAERIEAQLQCRVRHFAYPFGDFASFSPPAMAAAARRFDFIHSGLRGDNAPAFQRHAIRRDSQTPSDSLTLLGAFLEGASDFRYRAGNRVLDRWAAESHPRP